MQYVYAHVCATPWGASQWKETIKVNGDARNRHPLSLCLSEHGRVDVLQVISDNGRQL